MGLTLTPFSYKAHIQNRNNIAKAHLNNIKRFLGLNIKNKKKLYTAIVLPTLIYPTVPMNTISKAQMSTLQKTQNKALRFITNTHWTQHRTNVEIHNQLNMQPVNTIIHKQAKKTWETLATHLPNTYNTLAYNNTPNNRRHKNFQSSRLLAEGPQPDPIYS